MVGLVGGRKQEEMDAVKNTGEANREQVWESRDQQDSWNYRFSKDRNVNVNKQMFDVAVTERLSCASFVLVPQKCLRFNPDATVWKAKQQVLCSLTESLRDVLNYGLFQPATDGHDAKFLEEERLLREYPQSFEKGVPYLEVVFGPSPARAAVGHCSIV